MRLFIDTNLFMRFFTKDNQIMVDQVKKIFSQAESGKYKLATSAIVLSEIIYTLQSFYGLKKKDVEKHITYILEMKNLLLIDTTKFKKAFSIYAKHSQKISDCLIITQVPQNYFLCTFDKELKKLIGEKRFISPKQAAQ